MGEKTPYERFVEATRQIMSVPKTEVEKAMREKRRKRRRRIPKSE